MSDDQKPSVDSQIGMLDWIQQIVKWAIFITVSVCAWSIYNLNVSSAPQMSHRQMQADLVPAQKHSLTQSDSLLHARLQQVAPVALSLRVLVVCLLAVLAMILLRTGAAVIVQKSNEQYPESKEDPWNAALAPTSPGLIMILLATILLLVTVYYTFSFGEVMAAPTAF